MPKKLSFTEVVPAAIAEEMEKDDRVVVFGESVGRYGGVFGCTRGLSQRFGTERVKDTPISEGAIVGAAVGAAATGLRPVIEIMFVDFVCCGGGIEQILNQLSLIPFIGAGQYKLPVVIRMACGARYPVIGGGCHHSRMMESWFMHIPGIKVVTPSNPYDAKGLLKAAIRDDSPVVFFEPLALYYAKHKQMQGYPAMLSEIPDEEYCLPLGKASVIRQGNDVTIVALMMMVHKAIAAAEQLEKEGISVEIIDPRTLVPLDIETIANSIKKTGRLVVVSEDTITAGTGAEITAAVVERYFHYLKSAPRRVAALDLPIPYGRDLVERTLPQEEDIIAGARAVL